MPVVTSTGSGTGRLRQAGMGVGLVALAFAATAAYGTSNEAGAAGAAPLGSKTTASPASSKPSGSGSTSSQAERKEQAKEFTACMRSNGVEDFPGITILAGGTVKLDLNGKGVNPISAAYKKAAKTCSHVLPAGSTLPDDPTPPTVSEPALNDITCTGGDCPEAPKAPKAPGLPR